MASTARDDQRAHLLAAALAAADRGWPVFPAYPYSKIPCITDWHRRATCDPDTLTEWWAEGPYNVGVATGPAGLLVIDLDSARGEIPPRDWAIHDVAHGRDVLAVLADRAGAAYPGGTYTVSTPTGGYHLYYKAPPGLQLRNTTAKLGWRIDTRAAGGGIIAAGSVRRLRFGISAYTVARDAHVAALPEWLTAALMPRPYIPTAVRRLAGTRLGAWTKAALAGEAVRVREAAVGSRNDTLFTAACRLGELVGAGLLDESMAEATLRQAAAVHVGTHDFAASEADRAIASGLARGRLNPRRIAE